VPVATPISHESQSAPHRGHKLPEGMCAVNVFSLSKYYGDRVTSWTKQNPQSRQSGSQLKSSVPITTVQPVGWHYGLTFLVIW
jgi:hypothetical protein